MSRAIISPILRSSRLWYKAQTMLPAGEQDEVEYNQFHHILLNRTVATLFTSSEQADTASHKSDVHEPRFGDPWYTLSVAVCFRCR